MAGRGKLYAEKEGNAMKFDDTPSKEEREDFWLDLGPASAYEGLRSGWTHWAAPTMCRPSTDKDKRKSYQNKIHLPE